MVFEGLTDLPPPMHISRPEHLTRSVRRASGFVQTPIWLSIPTGQIEIPWATTREESRIRARGQAQQKMETPKLKAQPTS